MVEEGDDGGSIECNSSAAWINFLPNLYETLALSHIRQMHQVRQHSLLSQCGNFAGSDWIWPDLTGVKFFSLPLLAGSGEFLSDPLTLSSTICFSPLYHGSCKSIVCSNPFPMHLHA
jgi:hypothetical protein